AVILPESTLADADQLYRRLQAAVSARPIGQAGPLSFSAGGAELKAEDDPTTFFERADEALYPAKERGKAQVVASNTASRPTANVFFGGPLPTDRRGTPAPRRRRSRAPGTAGSPSAGRPRRPAAGLANRGFATEPTSHGRAASSGRQCRARARRGPSRSACG